MQNCNMDKIELNSATFNTFISPLQDKISEAPLLVSRSNRPLKLTLEEQQHSLIYFYLEEKDSFRDLIQDLEEDQFARENIASKDGIGKSSFSEAMNNRGLNNFNIYFKLYQKNVKDYYQKSTLS